MTGEQVEREKVYGDAYGSQDDPNPCDCGHIEEDHANEDGSCIVCRCEGWVAAP